VTEETFKKYSGLTTGSKGATYTSSPKSGSSEIYSGSTFGIFTDDKK
jgi:hypothetical protein